MATAPRSDRWATASVAVAGVFLFTGVLSVYVRDTLLDANEFAERGVATLDNDDVRAVVADNAIDTLIDAQPDLIARS